MIIPGMDVLTVCPLLVPVNSFATQYEGFLTAKGHDFRLSISLPPGGNVRGAKINCEWELQKLVQAYKKVLHKRLHQSPNLASFLVELKCIVERQLEKNPRPSVPPPVQYYDRLLQEIEILGWQHLMFIDSNFETLHLQATDSRDRSHILKVVLSNKHPDVAPQCTADLPQKFNFVWTSKTKSLPALLAQFEQQLGQYQEFWDMMDEIDQNTWVLEPEKPTCGATYRRIALGNNGSIQIDVDASQPHVLPECRFLGADHVVNPLKENLNNNLDKWNNGKSLLVNLQTVLNIELPSLATTSKEEFSVECGICYSYRLDSAIPDQVCDDPRCAQPFHQACLYEWLRALPTSRQSFNTVFGECPYCNKPITVKMPTK